MKLYILTNYWNLMGGDNGARNEVFTTREAAEARMAEIKEQFENIATNGKYCYFGDENTRELYDGDNYSNFDKYQLSEIVIELKIA